MEEIKFIGFKEFFKNRKHIKTIYNLMPLKEKYNLKWYLYSNCLINEQNKDIIWEWLHDDVSTNELKKCYRKVKI